MMYKHFPVRQIDEIRKQVIKVELKYSLGGYQIPRGIYFDIQPMVLTDRKDGYLTESWQHGTGQTFLIKELKRKSDKQMSAIGKLLYPHLESIVRMFQEKKSEDIKQLLTKLTA